MVNKVTLIGNLGKDPEIRHLEGGTTVGKFSLATNENYRDKNGEWQTQTEWHDIVVWRHLAERAAKDLHKGSMVYIEGKITHRKWQDKEGQDHYSTEIVASNLRLLDRREGQGSNNALKNNPADNFPSVDTAPVNRSEYGNAPAAENDDLPF